MLKIKLVGHCKKARHDVKCFTFEMVVDSDLTNFKELVELVVEKYPTRYLDVVHVQYFDEAVQTFSEVKSDQELMSMFSKHCKTNEIIMFIV